MAYYDQFFTEANLSKIFGVKPENHNTKLALEKLSELRVLRKTTNDEGSEVYTFVNMLQMHLRYESNAKIERRIAKDLKRLYRDGSNIIKARSKKKRKRGGSNNDGQADDDNDASSDSDDSDNEGKSDSEVEEDDDSDVGKSARGQDEQEDASKVEL